MELHAVLPQAGDHEALDACHKITDAPVSLTLTHMAAALGNYEALRLLLERGAQVNVRAHKNATPIFYSATSSTTRYTGLAI